MVLLQRSTLRLAHGVLLLCGLGLGSAPSLSAAIPQDGKSGEAIPATPLIKPIQAEGQEPAIDSRTAESPFAALSSAYQKDYQAWVAKIMALSEEERAKGFPDPPTQDYFPRFRTLAEDGDLQAVAWILDNLYGSGLAADQQATLRQRCLKSLIAQPNSPGAAQAVASALTYDHQTPAAEAIAMLQEVIAKAKDRDAVGSCYYALAQTWRRSKEPKAGAKALAALRTLAADYGDTFYGRYAPGLIFDAEHLQVGMLAPDFVGKSVDGSEIRLSDFRGQVTYLVFWGFW